MLSLLSLSSRSSRQAQSGDRRCTVFTVTVSSRALPDAAGRQKRTAAKGRHQR
ncbi:hypothetical protein AS9A_0450 [Hoyosella subflava DQS3-9A1]|uniref:Uncharacterized protein n=1 Tax=Hoyosella subflava (strain DSM 45089 / JCM 17490 / NBRC 109087 / DQS3-9A1) TaxID=443218 RepID=F6EHV9_HOYSD|nr:hypothetical protein AS9A_0450 [Hoyosella subflava DQS3-9A1]